ncbi:uncharacterized protein HKW66_Vig0156390 [Vigna angularis]|uniref:Uncharacterized protein n=1 Tax=Phaseolus angularis TaxID=3914 RepID=A0A8T0JM00_PHAAN|nr:uncharacterized protein HKW66_Vig0156390 [Vigna angularis]
MAQARLSFYRGVVDVEAATPLQQRRLRARFVFRRIRSEGKSRLTRSLGFLIVESRGRRPCRILFLIIVKKLRAIVDGVESRGRRPCRILFLIIVKKLRAIVDGVARRR